MPRRRAVFLASICLVAAFAASALVTGCGSKSDSKAPPTSTSQSANLTIYTVEAAGFSIGAPKTWKGLDSDMAGPLLEEAARDNPKMKPLIEAMQQPGTGIRLMAFDPEIVDGFSTNLNVGIEAIPPGTTLDEYTQANVQTLKSVFDVTPEESTTTLAAGEARLLKWATSDQGQTLTRHQYYLVEGDSGYVLTFTTNAEEGSKYDAIFEESANSFRLL